MIELLLVNSLTCVGFRVANESDKLLYPFFRKPISSIVERFKFLRWMENPLYGCLPCMSSFWGIVGLYAGGTLFDMDVIQIVMYILALCGLNSLMGDAWSLLSETLTKLIG